MIRERVELYQKKVEEAKEKGYGVTIHEMIVKNLYYRIDNPFDTNFRT